MANKAALGLMLAAVAGFVWWWSRPTAQGTKINAVAGLRG